MTRSIVVAALVFLGPAHAALASCDLGMVRPFTLATGAWSGSRWTLRAIDSGDGRYGLTVDVAGARRAQLSGRFFVRGRNGSPTEFGWTSSAPGARQPFVAGAVTEAAHVVRIGLSDRTVRTVRVIPPRCGLAPGISFFVAGLPRGTQPTFFSARDAAGKVVVRWRR